MGSLSSLLFVVILSAFLSALINALIKESLIRSRSASWAPHLASLLENSAFFYFAELIHACAVNDAIFTSALSALQITPETLTDRMEHDLVVHGVIRLPTAAKSIENNVFIVL